MKKAMLLVGAAILVCLGFVYGVAVAKYKVFPYYLMRAVKNDAMEHCPTVSAEKLASLRTIEGQADNVIWGDSVVEGMIDPRIYGLESWVSVGLNGQVTECAVGEMDYLLALKPKRVLIYLGGNDSDRQLYPPEVTAKHMEAILTTLKSAGIEPILHEIHGADAKTRDPEYLAELNARYRDLGMRYGVPVLPAIPELSFAGDYGGLAFDGEHLKGKGYALWFRKLAANPLLGETQP